MVTWCCTKTVGFISVASGLKQAMEVLVDVAEELEVRWNQSDDIPDHGARVGEGAGPRQGPRHRLTVSRKLGWVWAS